MTIQIELTFEGPVFFSPDDESAFFHWLNQIESVAEIRGQHRQLHVQFKHAPTDEETSSLLVLFRRWQIDILALEPFRTEQNGHHVLWRKSVAEATQA